jgi:hypothetical protein
MTPRNKVILIGIAAVMLFASGFYFGESLTAYNVNQKLINNEIRFCSPQAIINCREAASPYLTLDELPLSGGSVVTYNTTT